MTKKAIIERTINVIDQLPEDRAEEISRFADFVLRRYEELRLTEGIMQMTSSSHVFDFLNEDEELYSAADLKEVYNG